MSDKQKCLNACNAARELAEKAFADKVESVEPTLFVTTNEGEGFVFVIRDDAGFYAGIKAVTSSKNIMSMGIMIEGSARRVPEGMRKLSKEKIMENKDFLGDKHDCIVTFFAKEDAYSMKMWSIDDDRNLIEEDEKDFLNDEAANNPQEAAMICGFSPIFGDGKGKILNRETAIEIGRRYNMMVAAVKKDTPLDNSFPLADFLPAQS